MDYYKWDNQKNEKLKAEHDIGFEKVVMHIERGDVLRIYLIILDRKNIQMNKLLWLRLINTLTLFHLLSPRKVNS